MRRGKNEPLSMNQTPIMTCCWNLLLAQPCYTTFLALYPLPTKPQSRYDTQRQWKRRCSAVRKDKINITVARYDTSKCYDAFVDLKVFIQWIVNIQRKFSSVRRSLHIKDGTTHTVESIRYSCSWQSCGGGIWGWGLSIIKFFLHRRCSPSWNGPLKSGEGLELKTCLCPPLARRLSAV